jgi:2-oxo-4-hydroxy-4-carboxy-5-ureidoimidazoline decarboxylase
MSLAALNDAPLHEAGAALARCCGSDAWVTRMCAARPFVDRAALHREADLAAKHLTRADWLEAFAHHPRIGDMASLRERFATTAAWAGSEQSAAAAAPDSILEALAAGNRAYEARFGYIFIVCATGRPAAEMLAMLEARLPNEPAGELAIAAAEQMKITHLRLDKLLGGR